MAAIQIKALLRTYLLYTGNIPQLGKFDHTQYQRRHAASWLLSSMLMSYEVSILLVLINFNDCVK